MQILKRMLAGLAGLLICWLMVAMAGVVQPIVGVGKETFLVYFSILVFLLLFGPVQFFGLRLMRSFSSASIFCGQEIVYCFLLGLGVLPALKAANFIIGFIESAGAFEVNATRFFLLLVCAGIVDILFCVVSYVALWRIFWRSRGT